MWGLHCRVGESQSGCLHYAPAVRQKLGSCIVFVPKSGGSQAIFSPFPALAGSLNWECYFWIFYSVFLGDLLGGGQSFFRHLTFQALNSPEGQLSPPPSCAAQLVPLAVVPPCAQSFQTPPDETICLSNARPLLRCWIQVNHYLESKISKLQNRLALNWRPGNCCPCRRCPNPGWAIPRSQKYLRE